MARLLCDCGFEVLGQVGDPDALLELARADLPDVAVVDIRMPPTYSTEGLVAAQRLRAERPEAGVLLLSQYLESRHVMELLGDDPRGVGYLLKDRVCDIGQFAEAVRRVGSGGSVIDPDVVAQLLRRSRDRSPLDWLTPRERDVLALMAEGRSNRAIADALAVSQKTVETHVRSIFMKLGLSESPDEDRRVCAVLTYLRS